MAIVDLIMPKMGESITEATIISWQKQIGEEVETEEPVLDVATDKVDSDIPSPVTGTLIETFAAEGEVVQIGQVLARIRTEGGDTETSPESSSIQHAVSEKPVIEPERAPVQSVNPEPITPAPVIETAPPKIKSEFKRPATQIPATDGDRFYSPLVRNIARAEGISHEELDAIPGTGGGGRVTKHDLRAFIIQRRQAQTAAISNPMVPPSEVPRTEIPKVQSAPVETKLAAQPSTPFVKDTTASQAEHRIQTGDEIVEMDRMRRFIADHMKHSQEVSATVTTFIETDATHLVHWRNRNKDKYFEKYGEKLTFTPLFVRAVIQALRDYPMINASLQGEQIIVKRQINMGIATAMETGNLIVPVIKNAGELNLQGLTTQLNDLTGRARANQLKADEVQDGTFTISNIGTFGNIMGTPIINQPQLAILALGAIKKKPVIQETPHGDIIAIRHMMYLSLSFDHRVIDGYLGGIFLNRIAHYIEAFDPNEPL